MKNTKKAPVYASGSLREIFGAVSKAALLDVAWNLSLLGTDESEEQVSARFCRELVLVLEGRGDRVPEMARELALHSTDSDVPEEGGMA